MSARIGSGCSGRAHRAALARGAAAAALALLAGCGEGVKPPAAPDAGLSSPIAEVHPAARSTGVPYDTEVWVRFAVPLDPATANERTVFLKLDTVRIPSLITYDDATRTVHVVPQQRLALLRTHTVEITTGVAMTDGTTLGPQFWQFRTNGLRRPEAPRPAVGETNESPHVMLQWSGTEPAAGAIRYDVYAGPDSAAVAARSIPRVTVSQPYYVSRTPWGTDVRRYWAVDAFNLTTNEAFMGPVWSFSTLAAGTPVDSIVVPAADWAVWSNLTSRVTCGGTTITSGPEYHNGIRWQLAGHDLKLARAQLTAYASGAANQDLNTYQPHLGALAAPWTPCELRPGAPALESGPVASGTQRVVNDPIQYEGEAFTAYLEAAARFGKGNGFSFRSNRTLSVISPSTTTAGLEPVLKLFYYRTPVR